MRRSRITARSRRATVALLGVLGVIIVAIAIARANDSSDGSGGPPALALLLDDNTLVTVDGSGRQLRRTGLGHSPARPFGARYIASTAQRGLLLIVPGDLQDELAFATAEGRILKRIVLPRGVDFRAIEVGEATGRVYLGGEAATSQLTKEGSAARSAILTVVSSEGDVIATRTLRRPSPEGRFGPMDWQVYDIAVSPDERNVFLSYHGFNTGGADRIEVNGNELRRCPSIPTVSCIARIHGTIDVDESGLLATLGTPPLLGLFFEGARQPRLWKSGLDGAHVMEFARAGRHAFAVESCAKTGGLSVVDLRSGTARLLHQPALIAPLRGLPARAICGERISTASGSLIAVMKRGSITGIAGVMLLARSGRVIKWLPLEPAPVDVLVLR